MSSVDLFRASGYSLDIFPLTEDDDYFSDDSNLFIETIQEATQTPTNKEGLLRRLINIIRKALKWLADRWRQFIAWIAKKLGRKSKTADQCMETALNGKKIKGNSDGEDKVVSFNPDPLDDKYNPEPVDIKLIAKSLYIDFNNDTITLRQKDILKKRIKNNIANQFKKDAAASQPETPLGYYDMLNIFTLLYDPQFNKVFEDSVNLLAEAIKNPLSPNAATLINSVEQLNQLFSRAPKRRGNLTITIAQLNQVNDFIRRVNESLAFLDDPAKTSLEFSLKYGTPLLNALNTLSGIVTRLQYAVNYITGAMNQVHTVDANYLESIDDKDTLANFVSECINGNIPSKYIAYNVWAVCTKRLRGDADQKKPRMGQSRLVILPDRENTVLKIALNSGGIRDIRNEIAISKIVQDAQPPVVTRVVKAYGPNPTERPVAADVEKADLKRKATMADIMSVTDALTDALHDKGYWNIYIADIHFKNVGQVNGHWVVTDYGAVGKM